MARFKQSVLINQPAERVFAFVSDFENDPPWSGVSQVRRASPGPVGVGTTFQVRQRFLGRHLDVELEVVRYEPNRVITVKTTSSRFLSMTGTRLVEAAGERTQLTFLGTGHTRGLLKPLEPLLAAAAGGHRLQTQLARLKQCLETRPLRACRGYHRPAPAPGASTPRRATSEEFPRFAAPARRQRRALSGLGLRPVRQMSVPGDIHDGTEPLLEIPASGHSWLGRDVTSLPDFSAWLLPYVFSGERWREHRSWLGHSGALCAADSGHSDPMTQDHVLR